MSNSAIHYLVPLYSDRVLSKNHSRCLKSWIVLTCIVMIYIKRDSRASLRAQLVKNLPAMQETPVQFLGWEGPLEKGKTTHSSILAWRIQSKELQRGRQD